MIFAGSCYSELPVSSTYLMVKTSNGKLTSIDLNLLKALNFNLFKNNEISTELFLNTNIDLLFPILEKYLNMKIVELDLIITKTDDIVLTRNIQE